MIQKSTQQRSALFLFNGDCKSDFVHSPFVFAAWLEGSGDTMVAVLLAPRGGIKEARLRLASLSSERPLRSWLTAKGFDLWLPEKNTAN